MIKQKEKISLTLNKNDVTTLFNVQKFNSFELTTVIEGVDTLEGCEVELYIYKLSTNELISQNENITVSNNVVVIDIKNGAFDTVGACKGQFKIKDSEGQVTSAIFYFNVSETITDDESIVNGVGVQRIEEIEREIEEIKEVAVDGIVNLQSEINKTNASLDTKANKVYVSYEQFGAKGDGVIDDGEAIKLTHEYANTNGYSVMCKGNSKYLIKDTKGIVVNTNVDFNNSTIIIDENFVTNEPIFIFKTESYDLTTDELTFLQANVNLNIQRYESVKTFNGYFVKVEDSAAVICRRELGGSVENQYYKEIFAVNDDGSILCNNYQPPTMLGATLKTGIKYKIPKNILTFKNATFILTGESGSTYQSYHRYIHIGRSNVVVENINVEVLNDLGTIQRMFFRNENTYNVVFRNINAPDFANNTSYSSSTYVFSNMNTVNAKYYNINTPLYNPNFWGCFQSYYSKNLIIENSCISRFDSHFYGADIVINNTKFGYKAIQLQGYGYIKFNNCDVYSYTFINFREDFGATWDGSIYINECSLVYKNTSANTTGSIIRHSNTSTFDYGYITKLPNIFIKNFTFAEVDKMTDCVCIQILNNIGKTDTKNIIMSQKIDINNVITSKRIRVANILGDYIQNGESIISVKNISSVNNAINLYPANSGFLGIQSLNKPTNFYSPDIFIDKCKNISFGCKNSDCNLTITDSTINRINTLETSASDNMSSLKITNSDFYSNCTSTPTSGVPVNKLISKNTFLNNVTYKSLKINDVENTVASYIYLNGFFNSTQDGLLIDTIKVILDSDLGGYSVVSQTLKDKLKFNIT